MNFVVGYYLMYFFQMNVQLEYEPLVMLI